ncbi:MAG: hypothetical protein WC402_03025 [Candidatus Pacearchaeota archaeon]|jgi:hypothetical protein
MEKKGVFVIAVLVLSLFLVSSIHAEQVSNKVLCESSDGKWINEECQCPSNSVGFKEGFGCDYKSSYYNQEPVDSKNSANQILLIALIGGIVLLIILIILIKILKKNKNGKK